MLVPFSVVPFPRFSYSLYASVFAWASWLSSLCCAYFASQMPGLCSASILVSFPFCTRLFVLSVCLASQTPGLCSASIFCSLPLLHTFICFVTVLRLANTGFMQCFYLGSLPLLHTFICFVTVLRLANTRFVLRFPFAHVCLCQCASPCRLRVCAVMFNKRAGVLYQV